MRASSSPRSILRYRRQIGAEGVAVWADVKKKHSAHAITADVSIGEMAATIEFMRADAVIVTGSATGASPTWGIPLLCGRIVLRLYLGSGITAENLPQYVDHADGFIVESALKKDGRLHESVDERRVDAFMSV